MKKRKLQNNPESLFLQGAGNRWKDLVGAIKIMMEFVRGFRKLHFVGPCVTVFGSARFQENNEYYQNARKLAQLLAVRGFTIMTGGGPGIMEAANRGAKDVDGRSVGCNIILPQEQNPNPYLDIMIDMDHFYVRKVLLMKYSYAYVVMPGGFGTLDEFFETLVLIQTHKIKQFPVVLFGKKYWSNLLEQIEDMKVEKTIAELDTDLFFLTDSIEESERYILTKLKEKYLGKEISRQVKRRWWLLENFNKTRNEKQQYVIKLD